jgi:hypothetical protein
MASLFVDRGHHMELVCLGRSHVLAVEDYLDHHGIGVGTRCPSPVDLDRAYRTLCPYLVHGVESAAASSLGRDLCSPGGSLCGSFPVEGCGVVSDATF